MNSLVQSPQRLVERSRWWAFGAVCLGFLLIEIDGTNVNIALRSIQADLGFSQLSLIWVVNAYLITFGGFLLIGGRLGDLFGPRRLFLCGIVLFMAASAVCGATHSRAWLIGARAVQGLGSAVVAPIALSFTMSLFSEGPQRAAAFGIYIFLQAFGASVGLLLSGLLVSILNWHWIFLINLPLGAVAYTLCLRLPPDGPRLMTRNRLDTAGAAAVTVSLTLAVYGVVNAGKVGWSSVQTLTCLAGACASLILFLYIEAGVSNPVIPLSLFKRRNLVIANAIYLLAAFATTGWYFISALYLQMILRYSAEQTGLAFLPFSLTGAALSLGVGRKLVVHLGTKLPVVCGLLIAFTGIISFARVPLHGDFADDILPGMLLVGLGNGAIGIPTLLVATKGAAPSESGFVSGIMTTAAMIGGALGLAILLSAASACTNKLLAAGASLSVALNDGYHVAFFAAAGLYAVAIFLSATFLPKEERAS